MAFNLDKNNSPAKSEPIKKTGFNLTKDQATTLIPTQQTKKYRSVFWGLLSVLLIGSIIWYITSIPGNTTKDTATVSGTGSNTIPDIDPVESNEIQAPDALVATEDQAMSNERQDETLEESSDPVAENPAGDIPTNEENKDKKVAASFQKGSVDAYMIDKSVVDDIIKFLKANPDAVITLNGYSSSEGPIKVNQQISQARADVFKTYLVSKGISENKILATGKGIENPLASNETEQGRGKNRRVEILLQ
jgi:outer membrane protein OmpA-like peptidoglycan-associated protein